MDNRKAIVRQTRQYGQGVFAESKILKGEVIAIFDGNFLDDDFENKDHAIQYCEDGWRDSNGIARLINHSCEANCGIKDYFKVVAMRDIEAGEHITWDYEMTERSSWWKMECRCGTPHCRGVIGNYEHMPQAVREKYSGYISEWLTGKPLRPRRARSG